MLRSGPIETTGKAGPVDRLRNRYQASEIQQPLRRNIVPIAASRYYAGRRSALTAAVVSFHQLETVEIAGLR
jgi:hypothetical protein